MDNSNGVPDVSGEDSETSLLPSRNTERNGAMYDTDGVAPDDSTEEEAVAIFNSMKHVIDRLTSRQHLSESDRQKNKDLVQKMRDMMESLDETHNTVDAPEDPTEMDHLDTFKTILHLPEEVERLKLIQLLSKKVRQERNDIINKLRYMAKFMEASQNDSLQKDRIGTGIGIGGGLLIVAGIAAAPFTGGISVVLTTTGIFGGLIGAGTSMAANLSSCLTEKEVLNSLEQELKEHVAHIEELSSLGSTYLTRALRMRPTLEALGRLSVENLTKLITVFRTSTMGEMKESAMKDQTLNTDPEIRRLIEMLPLHMSSEFLQELDAICTLIRDKIHQIKEAINVFLKFFDHPEFFMAAVVGNQFRRSTTTVSTCAKSTGSIGTNSARKATLFLTTAFIVLDVIHMISIWNATGNSPNVQQLRKIADDLEAEIQNLPQPTEN